jgi:hypothetical protein
MSFRPTRRGFLRGASGAALALPLLESRIGRAQAAPVPTRLVIYQTGEGNLSKLWSPPALANDALQLSEMLKPLAAHQNKMVVVSGVANKVAKMHLSNDHIPAGHTIMTSALLDCTGTGVFDATIRINEGALSLGPSIDHYLASQLKINEPINLAVGSSNPSENRMWYRMKTAGAAGISNLSGRAAADRDNADDARRSFSRATGQRVGWCPQFLQRVEGEGRRGG